MNKRTRDARAPYNSTAMNTLRIKRSVVLVLALMLWDEIAAFGASSCSIQRHSTVSSRLLAQCTTTDTDTVSNVLPENVKELKIHLDTGIDAQVFVGKPPTPPKLPPLVFIHGSFHAGWCWTERFFPYFIEKGYPVIALSLRGTGGTFAGEGVKKVRIGEHAADLASFLNQVPKLVDTEKKPILISHSFGGLAVMKYLEQNGERAETLGGMIIMCSVPPSGNGKMTMRFLKRSLVDSWKITAGFAMKRCIQNDSLCRDLFFGGRDDDNGVSDEDIERYQRYFARDTEAVIDIKDLLKHLPSKQAVNGKAPNVDKFSPCLVIGAQRDFIVDREGVEETATYFGVSEPLYVDSPHDVMLGRNWEITANIIQNWVKESVVDEQ